MSDEIKLKSSEEINVVVESEDTVMQNDKASDNNDIKITEEFSDQPAEPKADAESESRKDDCNEPVISNKTSSCKPRKSLSVRKIIQLSAAIVLTVALLVAYPVYSWFRIHRQIARYEKISVPNSLYLAAARREDSRFLEMDNIDINATWIDDNGVSVGKAYYQDYVFTVAGDYVQNYILQLAHTTNNNYYYEIFEADVTDVRPTGKVLGRDYVEYTLKKDYDPELLADFDNDVYKNANAGTKLYYSVKKDIDGNEISLNASAYTVIKDGSNNIVYNVVDSVYYLYVDPEDTSLGTETVSYNGHYLNRQSDFAAWDTGDYHDKTYGTSAAVDSGPDSDVHTNAEPLYWQVQRSLPIDGSVSRDSFFHEYILRVSWNSEDPDKAPSAEYKDTDIVYISVADRVG